MEKKSILILGAGVYQVPLIKKARELGYRTVVCSIEGNYPGFALADKVYYANTTDKHTCLEIAKKEDVCAVCTAGTDVALPTIGYINDQLHLCGPTEKATLLATDKSLMKEAFVAGGVRTAAYEKVDSAESCVHAIQRIGLPCIMKVVDSSGSRGIEVVRDLFLVPEIYNRIQKYTRQPYIVVEKFLEGIEFGAQAFVYNGELLFVMPHSDEVFQGDAGVPIGHTVPFMIPDDKDFTHKVWKETEKSIKALEIDNAAVNMDFILVDGIPYVLEVGARSGATGLAELVSYHYDVDYYAMIIMAAVGTLNVTKYTFDSQRAVTSLLLTADRTGTIHVPGRPSHPNLLLYEFDYKEGDAIHEFRVGPDRLGNVITWGTSAEESKQIAHDVVDNIELKID